MRRIHGPYYSYAGEKLNQPEVMVVFDHHYNADLEGFAIEQLITNSVIDPKNHVVIFDHVLQHDDVLSNYNLIFFPSFLARENREFIATNIEPNWSHRSRTFNFMINKPRPHRELLLRLIKQHHLQNYSHSLAWKINNINDIPVTDYRLGSEIALDRGLRAGTYVTNARIYQTLLQKNVFEPSCVSLITEPAYYERETIITEKTLMAMWAGTIPIWVGGWSIPQYLKNLGFDVFDDIVDHSYQDHADPETRCRRAIELNLDLLNNFDRTQNLHHSLGSRLRHNLELLKLNLFEQVCMKKIQQHPPPVKTVLQKLIGVDKV